MLPKPSHEAMSEMPCYFIGGVGGCVLGWEDDPDSDMPSRRWRLVACRVEELSVIAKIILTQTINKEDQVKMTGSYLRDNEVLLSSRFMGHAQNLCRVGFIEPTTRGISLSNGTHMVVRRRPCVYEVYGLRMPAWG